MEFARELGSLLETATCSPTVRCSRLSSNEREYSALIHRLSQSDKTIGRQRKCRYGNLGDVTYKFEFEKLNEDYKRVVIVKYYPCKLNE